MTSTPIAIIGAGIGGLSAAIALAAKGQRVAIYEQLNRPGGKMGELRVDGFRWDTGPSVITMRHMFERLFREAGCDFNERVQLLPLNPITRYFWRDGLVLDAVADEDAMCARIAEFAPNDVEGYRRFLRYARQLHDLIGQPFLYRQQPTLKDLFKLPLADALRIDSMRSMHQAVKAHFRDPHLIQLFDRFATYNGSSPYQVPATLNVIAHVEMAMGAWYPRGGVYRIAQAMADVAQSLGVEIHYGEAVQEINLQVGKIAGLRLANGQTVAAQAVIANADVTHIYAHLLPTLTKPRRWLEPSCSGFVLLFGVGAGLAPTPMPMSATGSVMGDRTGASLAPTFAHHNILFSDDYPREFDDIFKRKLPTDDPTIYICITSKTDPDHAPPNHENWFVLVNVPYLSPAFDWAKDGAAYAERVKRLLAERAGLSADRIVFERCLTPQDLQKTFGGHQGSIYGFSSNTKLAAFMRPNNRARDVKGLYFASGSAHPGGGVPLVTLSGMAAAQCIQEDWA